MHIIECAIRVPSLLEILYVVQEKSLSLLAFILLELSDYILANGPNPMDYRLDMDIFHLIR